MLNRAQKTISGRKGNEIHPQIVSFTCNALNKDLIFVNTNKCCNKKNKFTMYVCILVPHLISCDKYQSSLSTGLKTFSSFFSSPTVTTRPCRLCEVSEVRCLPTPWSAPACPTCTGATAPQALSGTDWWQTVRWKLFVTLMSLTLRPS